MSAGGQLVSSLEESILKRTIYIATLPEHVSEDDLMKTFLAFGSVQTFKVDRRSGDYPRMALIQFVDEQSAYDALRCSRIYCGDSVLVAALSRVTIEVIPPMDAVLGKPMTVGRHVMAVNPSKINSSQQRKREDCMKRVKLAANKISDRIYRELGRERSRSRSRNSTRK